MNTKTKNCSFYFWLINFNQSQTNNLVIYCFSYGFYASLVLLFNVSIFSQTTLDNQTYNYKPNTNQLNYIADAVGSSASTIDIDNQVNYNYTYNVNGQIKTDVAEGIISIEWNVAGKVKKVNIDDSKPHDGTADRTLAFLYDAMGNRIKKTETIIATGKTNITYYSLSATGELMALYESDGITTKRKEIPLSIGEDKTIIADATTPLSPSHIYTRALANKNYELKDQLASVRVVINDVKTPSLLERGRGEVVFQSSIQSTSDNYAFGAEMPMRTYNNSDSRYGFQGYEKDNELKGEGNSYITNARMYDPRVGRWLSTDPLEDKYPSTSTYCAMNNDPINKVDFTGKGWELVVALMGTSAPANAPATNEPTYASENDYYLKCYLALIATTEGELALNLPEHAIAAGKSFFASISDLGESIYYGYGAGGFSGALTMGGYQALYVTPLTTGMIVSLIIPVGLPPDFEFMPSNTLKISLTEEEQDMGRAFHYISNKMPTPKALLALQKQTGGEVAVYYESTDRNGLGTFHIVGDGNANKSWGGDFVTDGKYTFIAHTHPYNSEASLFPSVADRDLLTNIRTNQGGSIIYTEEGTTLFWAPSKNRTKPYTVIRDNDGVITHSYKEE